MSRLKTGRARGRRTLDHGGLVGCFVTGGAGFVDSRLVYDGQLQRIGFHLTTLCGHDLRPTAIRPRAPTLSIQERLEIQDSTALDLRIEGKNGDDRCVGRAYPVAGPLPVARDRYYIAKPIVDLILALILILVSIPILLIIAIAIRFDSFYSEAMKAGVTAIVENIRRVSFLTRYPSDHPMRPRKKAARSLSSSEERRGT